MLKVCLDDYNIVFKKESYKIKIYSKVKLKNLDKKSVLKVLIYIYW